MIRGINQPCYYQRALIIIRDRFIASESIDIHTYDIYNGIKLRCPDLATLILL